MDVKYVLVIVFVCVVFVLSHSIAFIVGEKRGIKSMVKFYKFAYPKKYFTNLKRLEYKGYNAIYSYDERDDIFYGTINGIKDMVDFHSENEDQIEQQFHNAVDDYIKFCSDIGKEPDRPKKEEE